VSLHLPTINFLKQNTDERMTIMGSSAMGFALGFPDNFVDDGRFGYASGRQPEIIVFAQESEQSVQEAHAFLPFYPRFRPTYADCWRKSTGVFMRIRGLRFMLDDERSYKIDCVLVFWMTSERFGTSVIPEINFKPLMDALSRRFNAINLV
jgi:hypothetical protein